MTIHPSPAIPSTQRDPRPPRASGNGWLVAALALAFAGLVAIIAVLVNRTSGHGPSVFTRSAALAFVHAANRGDSAVVSRMSCPSLARGLTGAPVQLRFRSLHASGSTGRLRVAIGFGTAPLDRVDATLYMRRHGARWQFCEHPFGAGG